MDRITNASHRGPVTVSEARNRRAAARIEAQFCTLMSVDTLRMEGSGTVLDLSAAGCRLKSSFTMPESSLIELRIHIPDLNWIISVVEAIVQCVNDNIMGLRFDSLRPTEGDRLTWVLARMAHDGKRS
jgi:hypothetical protein